MQPPDWRIYITPGLVLLSAIIAFIAMLNTRKVARERATLDLIEKVESGEHYREIAHTFTELRRGRGFTHLSNPKTDEDQRARRCVNDYMNHYEMVAIGIRAGILDETFYRDWMRGPLVRDWNAAAKWVQRERWKRKPDGPWEYYEKTFLEYEHLARKWSHEAIVLNEEFGPPPSDEEAGAPGADPLPPAPEEQDEQDIKDEAADAAPVVDEDAPKGGES